MSKPDASLRLMSDGTTSVLGGVNCGSHPAIIKEDEIAFGYNVTVRGGFPRTRPRVMTRCLVFQSAEQETWFTNKLVQGYGDFTYPNGDVVEVVSVAGRLFKIDVLAKFVVSEITPRLTTATTADFISPPVGATADVTLSDASRVFDGYPVFIAGGEYAITARIGNILTVKNTAAVAGVLSASGAAVAYLSPNIPQLPLAWFKQAGKWLVCQNGKDDAIVFDGNSSKRRPVDIPVGKMMEYAEGRLWVVDDNDLVAAGDMVDPFDDEAVITFSEDKTIELGGRFQLPFGSGAITGIRVIPNLDTGQGQGPLLVFSEAEVGSINVPSFRAQWKTVAYPITRLVQSNYGGSSQYSLTVVNGDIWNRALDGIRSFVMAAAAFNDWGNVPQSREVRRVLDKDTPELLKYASGILFDNRALFTFGPMRTPNGVKHRGIVALDFDVISALGRRETPVYDGVWTGFQPTFLMQQVFRGKNRAFALTLNAQNQNEFWEITNEYGLDNDSVRPRCFIETRSMDWKSPFDLKRLKSNEMWIDEIVGPIDLTIHWKPDYSPQACWYGWAAKQICVKSEDCTITTGCKPARVFNPGYRTRISFGEPPDVCEPNDNKPARILYRAQLRIAWVGIMALKAVLVKAQDVPEHMFSVDDCNAVLLADDSYILRVWGVDRTAVGADQMGIL